MQCLPLDSVMKEYISWQGFLFLSLIDLLSCHPSFLLNFTSGELHKRSRECARRESHALLLFEHY